MPSQNRRHGVAHLPLDFSRGLLAEDIMAIFGVLLRDDILKKKNSPVADVDKTPAG
jgi:hypothetical protein